MPTPLTAYGPVFKHLFQTSIKANDYSFYKYSTTYYVPGTTRGHAQNRPRAPAFMESTFY